MRLEFFEQIGRRASRWSRPGVTEGFDARPGRSSAARRSSRFGRLRSTSYKTLSVGPRRRRRAKSSSFAWTLARASPGVLNGWPTPKGVRQRQVDVMQHTARQSFHRH